MEIDLVEQEVFIAEAPRPPTAHRGRRSPYCPASGRWPLDHPQRVATTPLLQDRPALCADRPSGGAVGLTVPTVVPAHLLGGDEVVHFAIKPSPWFVILVSLRWLGLGILLILAAGLDVVSPQYRWLFYQSGFVVAGARLGWAMLEWVSRLYVLTDRRVMRIRGVFNVDLFECTLERIQNTVTSLPLTERVVRVGTISFHTAGGSGGAASWRIISRPLEIHEQVREAIGRAQHRQNNGL
jgi:hypothetical protein